MAAPRNHEHVRIASPTPGKQKQSSKCECIHSRLALPMLSQCWYNGFPTHTVPVSYIYVKSMSHSWGAKWHLSPRLPGTRPLPGGSASANIRLWTESTCFTPHTKHAKQIPTYPNGILFLLFKHLTYCYITIEWKKKRRPTLILYIPQLRPLHEHEQQWLN